MAHNIDFSTGKPGIAFAGSREDIWHGLGQQMLPGMGIDTWAKAAGLDWRAEHCVAVANLQGELFDGIPANRRFAEVPNFKFVVRSDNGHVLGWGTDVRQEVQPVDLLRWFERYISVDDRFALDVAGSLREGEIIWATATYKEPLTVGGDAIKGRLLMTTAYDGSMSTINKATTTRVVCNNTLSASLADKRCEVRTRHNTKFDPAAVAKELAAIAKGFDTFKAVGDALAQNEMAGQETSAFFKSLLDIDPSIEGAAGWNKLTTRKQNQWNSLREAYRKTVEEGAPDGTAWAALNAVTRYVDHERTTRQASGSTATDLEVRALSSQFGSGAAMKGEAMALLLPRVRDKVPLAA